MQSKSTSILAVALVLCCFLLAGVLLSSCGLDNSAEIEKARKEGYQEGYEEGLAKGFDEGETKTLEDVYFNREKFGNFWKEIFWDGFEHGYIVRDNGHILNKLPEYGNAVDFEVIYEYLEDLMYDLS